MRILMITLAASLAGCASIVNDSTHPMKVDTKTADGSLVGGADCRVSNDYGATSFRSGDTIQVRRSNKDLDITCTMPSKPTAIARAISRANAGFAGNILIGGIIGAVIDHSKGTAYTYPTWVQLVFGKTLIFDRSAESGGQPTPGTEPNVDAGLPSVTPSRPVSSTAGAGPAPRAPEPRTGPDSRIVERLPEVLACNREPTALLVGDALTSLAVYSVKCTTGETITARCEYGTCRVLR